MTGKRAKIVLTADALHRLLGLPEGVRVVGVRAESDPDMACVLVEGDDLPAVDYAETAYAGGVGAPFLWHPIQGNGTEAPRLTWGEWKPGDRRPELTTAGSS